MTDESPPHQRRVRYSGKNPVRFEDKYKEHNPTKYAEDVQRIVAKGNTPAGSHRPIMVEEILSILKPGPGETALDATLGYGGHSSQILPGLLPGGRLWGIDVDPLELPRSEARLRAQGYAKDVFIVRHLNFSAIESLVPETKGGFDCVLADLGVSSMQLDNPSRGFTYKADGPLDLRLDPERGFPASEMIVTINADKLERFLFEYADEPRSREIARAIKSSKTPLETTTQMADCIKLALFKVRPRPHESEVKKSLQRTFMALRIAVNQEFSALERFLDVLPQCLKPGARVAVLSFHSGEDRRVKEAFALAKQYGLYSEIASTPIRPGEVECRSNPRASPAKLRWAVRSDLFLD